MLSVPTKRGHYDEDEKQSIPGVGGILSKLVKRTLAVGVEVDMRTTGEFIRYDEYIRDVKTMTTYTDKLSNGKTERYYQSGWLKTGNSKWVKSGYNIKSYLVNGRLCPITCINLP